MTLGEITVGDYVIADRAMYDTWTETFRVTCKDRRNMLGEPLVDVVDIARPDRSLTFYPSELSFEA